uniref:Potassium channel domain-containing protein n=1 Tax=Strigamia maritima TaxID=126957 RepID=T1JCQ6_STRMM
MNKKECFILLLAFIFYLAIGSVVFLHFENGSAESSEPLLRDIKGEVEEFWSGAVRKNMTWDETWHLARGLYQIATDSSSTNKTVVYTRNWHFYDGFFFSLTVITTIVLFCIGYGHLAPISPGGQIFCIFYALFGVPMTGILIANFGNFFSVPLLRVHERSKRKHFSATQALIFNTFLYLVPGMVIFLFLPAVAFTFLEEDWSYLESFYFAFITLTTIGFGDYVAGISDELDLDHRWMYQVGLTFWIIFGLGYLSMMFNFISKALKSKPIQRINKTVGKGFRQTKRLISKEMEEFVRTMNSHPIKSVHGKRRKKLKRTQSMPLLWRSSVIEVNRSASDSQLSKSKKKDEDIYTIQYEANTNTMGFIVHLAKALAFGDLGMEDNESNSSIDTRSCRSSILEALTETIRQISRKNSLWDSDSQTKLTSSGYLPNRLSMSRRSYDLLSTPSRFSAVLDIPSELHHPRRKSDFGSYRDMRSWREPSVSQLDGINEIRGSSSLENEHYKSAKQEINELLCDLQNVEDIWKRQRHS